jgi:hypothetical protein
MELRTQEIRKGMERKKFQVSGVEFQGAGGGA